MKKTTSLLALILIFAGIPGLGQGLWLKGKAELAQWLLEKAWQRSTLAPIEGGPRGLMGPTAIGANLKPWPWADTQPIGRLIIPDLRSNWVVLAGSSGRNLAFAPTLLDGSQTPSKGGVTVVSAHKDTHFKPLQDLRPGSLASWVSPELEVKHFRLEETFIANANTEQLDLSGEESLLLLVTCFPSDAPPGSPLRKVFVFTPVPESHLTSEKSRQQLAGI